MIFKLPSGTDIAVAKEWLIENIGPLYRGSKDIGEGWNMWSEMYRPDYNIRIEMQFYVKIDGRKCRKGGMTAFKLKFI